MLTLLCDNANCLRDDDKYYQKMCEKTMSPSPHNSSIYNSLASFVEIACGVISGILNIWIPDVVFQRKGTYKIVNTLKRV